jgi:hypothetical protein
MNVRHSTTGRAGLGCSAGHTLLAILIALLIGVISLPGCSGCNWGGSPTAAKSKTKKKDDKKADDLDSEIEKKLAKQKKEKPKDDFEPLALRMLPSNDPSPSLKQPQMLVKPGHWIAVSETAKTNNFDFPGELATFAERQATSLPLEVENTTSRMSSWCPAILPKGQSKRIEGLFYVPRQRIGLGAAYSLRSELRGIRGGRMEIFNTAVSRSLKEYEHMIVVLAGGGSTPAAYTHFDRLISVRTADVAASESETLRYYHVFRPTVDKSAPLPSSALAWTTIAYLFWDDLDPAVLTSLQQQALLDWLHWGGQLVISGPNSLDKLRSSFLEPYLPGESKQTVKLLQADFDELNARFSLERNPLIAAQQTKAAKGEKLYRITVSEERPMVGLELSPHPAASEIEGTGGLVVERRVGGGRVVVTRFPLTDVRIKQWKNFDGFFNTVLLRRPGRIFSQGSGTADSLLSVLAVHWNDPNLEQMLLESRLGSTLRYFTRDIGFIRDGWEKEALALTPRPSDAQPATAGFPRGPVRLPSGRIANAPVYGAPGYGPGMPGYAYGSEKIAEETSAQHPDIDDWRFCGYGGGKSDEMRKGVADQQLQPAGIAAWDDEGAASEAARQILTEAAGIEIPSAAFVMKVLAIYLLVLVPLNWLLFWLMGKVEWAWIAAPLIALLGAGAVIRLAQLDIGFARSRTEVAVLEMQGGYERAHLTRYTALYSSLSSSYTLAFDEPSALAAPFPAKRLEESLLSITQYTDVAFRRDKEISLAGVQVSSNSTGMVHSEQMLTLGKSPKTLETLRLVGDNNRGYSVSNTTDLTVRDIGVFRRVDVPSKSGRTSPEVEAAYVARLEPASSAPLVFKPLVVKEVQRRSDATRDSPAEKKTAWGPTYPLVWLDAWDSVPIFADPERMAQEGGEELLHDKTRIRLTRLARLAAQRLRLLPGDVRLIGWTDQRVPGMRIRPEAPQNNTYTLVLAHLARGALPAVQPDKNLAEDYIDPTILEAEAQSALEKDGIDYDPATLGPAVSAPQSLAPSP